MDEPEATESAESRAGISDLLADLRPHWWKIAGLSLAAGLIAFLWTLREPDIYRATAIITPAAEENRQSPTIGVLASYGIAVGGPSKVEDLETLLKSNDLTVRVFRKYDIWPILKPKSFNPKTGKLVPGWKERVLSVKDAEGRVPGDWDAIRISQKGLTVQTNRRSNTISLTFESPSAEGSTAIIRYYLDEAKSRLQEEALERSTRNKKFITEQIGLTVDALMRDRLYSTYGQELEREMMARNREQFGFKVIDAPRAPDFRSKPDRVGAAVTTVVVSLPVWCMIFMYRRKKRTTP